MDDLDVQVDGTTTETHQEVTEQQADDVKQQSAEEAVDESGVPLKNREAEAARKAKKAERMSQSQAESALLSGDSSGNDGSNSEDAIEIVTAIANQQAKKALEPLLAKQFLLENPDARDLIEDINRVRASHPEIAGIDNLDLVYRIVKAEKQDEIIRNRVEAERLKDQETLNESKNASLEGTGKAKSSGTSKSLEDQIANASSLEDLQKLESLIP